MVRCTSYCWNNSAFQSIGSLSFFCFEAPPKAHAAESQIQPKSCFRCKKAIFCQLGLGSVTVRHGSEAKAPLSGNNGLQADVVAEGLEFLYLGIPAIFGLTVSYQ